MFKSSKPQSFESYLSQIAHELRDLPLQARADEMREIEAHLRAMIEVQGDVAATLAQFGAPRKFGRDLRRAWERKQPESWINAALALVVICLFISAHNYFWINFSSNKTFVLHPSVLYYFDLKEVGSHATFFFHLATECIFTLIVGTIVGLSSPKRGCMLLAFLFPLLVVLDFFPFISIGIARHFLSLLSLTNYTVLFLCLLLGARISIRLSRERFARIARAK